MMHSFFTFFSSIVLLGALQGFIISILLFYSKKPGLSNRLLSGVIFLLAWASLKIYLNSQEWFSSSTLCSLIEAFVPFFVVMPVGPLIFLYVKSFVEPDLKLTPKLRRHFLPVIIDIIPHLTAIIYVAGLALGVLEKSPSWGNFIDHYYVYSDIPRWISVSVYLWLSARLLSSNKPTTNDVKRSPVAGYRWLWLLIRVFIAFQFIWLVHLVPYVMPRYSDALINSVDWFPVYLPLTGLIYWLGIKGYIMSFREPAAAVKTAGSLSVLSTSDIQQAVMLLQQSMEEHKLYLDPTLNLNFLAAHTGLPQKTISAVLNQYLHKSFNEFVNGYRVEALKVKIQQPGMEKLTIAGIAYECGFNSQATFQRSFKDITGMSPSAFRKTVMGDI